MFVVPKVVAVFHVGEVTEVSTRYLSGNPREMHSIDGNPILEIHGNP